MGWFSDKNYVYLDPLPRTLIRPRMSSLSTATFLTSIQSQTLVPSLWNPRVLWRAELLSTTNLTKNQAKALDGEDKLMLVPPCNMSSPRASRLARANDCAWWDTVIWRFADLVPLL